MSRTCRAPCPIVQPIPRNAGCYAVVPLAWQVWCRCVRIRSASLKWLKLGDVYDDEASVLSADGGVPLLRPLARSPTRGSSKRLWFRSRFVFSATFLAFLAFLGVPEGAVEVAFVAERLWSDLALLVPVAVCVRRCVIRFPFCAKVRSQTWHLWGRSPVCH